MATREVFKDSQGRPVYEVYGSGDIGSLIYANGDPYGGTDVRNTNTTTSSTSNNATLTNSSGTDIIAPTAQVTPGPAQAGNQINVVDYAGQLVTDPTKGLITDDPDTPQNESMFLQDHTPDIDPNTAGTNIDGGQAQYQMDIDQYQQQAAQGVASTAQQVDPRDTATYTAQQTQQNVGQNAQGTAAQGTVSQGSQITAPQIDVESIATGVNPDSTINEVGQALKEYAEQDLNSVDPKATLKGQIDILQEEFVGPNGEPKIPSWAASTARSVSKIAAFKGITGTAATAAMSQALLEASIGIAQQDAKFFQTVTLANLDNKQQATINRANTLSRMEEWNADARLTAAIQNSKSFLEMDLANLSNEQQMEILNTQSRVQSILEDAKAVNTQRLFTAESANEMSRFYDELNTRIGEFNASQKNNMEEFNVSGTNSMRKFNSELSSSREQFYKEMQYNIDLANAKWRQTVTLAEAEMSFEAAATDVKNMLGISQESLNQIWDRSDSLLDYLWKSAENELDRKNRLAVVQLQGDISAAASTQAGIGSVFGTVAGAAAENFFDWLF